jgi:hypothetical protein
MLFVGIEEKGGRASLPLRAAGQPFTGDVADAYRRFLKQRRPPGAGRLG